MRFDLNWNNISKPNKLLAIKMHDEESISLHIRKLEPVKNIKQFLMLLRIRLVWRTCSASYFYNAIKLIEKKVENPKFYVFTDNLNWVERNLKLPHNVQIINWNKNKDSYQDMFLMCNCKHNIISMSSFSWWST